MVQACSVGTLLNRIIPVFLGPKGPCTHEPVEREILSAAASHHSELKFLSSSLSLLKSILSQVNSSQLKSSELKSSELKTSQVNSSQVKLTEVKSSQVN